MKIAAVGDIHVRENSRGLYKAFIEEVSQKADVLVLCGDLTDHGTVEEANVLAEDMLYSTIPIVGVLGNHDFESGHAKKLGDIFGRAKMIVLGDEPWEYNGVGFAGVKGFGGGFGRHMLGIFGEDINKKFVYEAVNEALKLENALGLIKSEKKVVVMHYTPVKETIEGESPEIFPFLGSSRFEEPIERFDASVVFHGHANLGKLQGKTQKGIPVYNVALPLLESLTPPQKYHIVEI